MLHLLVNRKNEFASRLSEDIINHIDPSSGPVLWRTLGITFGGKKYANLTRSNMRRLLSELFF